MPYACNGSGNCYGRGDYYQGDYYRGDPGLFGNIFKGIVGAVKGFATGGPTGAVLGGARAFAQAAVRRPTSTALIPYGGQVGPNISQVAAGGLIGGLNIAGPVGGGGQVPMVVGPGGQLCTIKGTHVNKRAYFTKSAGYIEAGTRCVKNRRMQVTNTTALRRAIRRARGFIKIARKTVGVFGLTVQRRGMGRKVARRK